MGSISGPSGLCTSRCERMDQDEISNKNGNDDHEVRMNILNHLADNENIRFKSQQLGEPELERSEKVEIAAKILDADRGAFLSRFGHFLNVEHLNFFDDTTYEVQYYLNLLRKNKCASVTSTQVKNRRFEALKRLISQGEYFSVSEMRKRNPLLYHQLLGGFLSDNADHENTWGNTMVDLLMEQIEQDKMVALQKCQEEEERIIATSVEINLEDEEMKSSEESAIAPTCSYWGEIPIPKKDQVIAKRRWKQTANSSATIKKLNRVQPSDEEKMLLVNEFTSAMFTSFLQGKDDYNYEDIDNNADLDDIAQCNLDEEEKYFDSETPQEASPVPVDNCEDELYAFMKKINEEVKEENFLSDFKNKNSC